MLGIMVFLVIITSFLIVTLIPAISAPHSIFNVANSTDFPSNGTVTSVVSYHGSAWFGLTSKMYTNVTVSVADMVLTQGVNCNFFSVGQNVSITKTTTFFQDKTNESSYSLVLPAGC